MFNCDDINDVKNSSLKKLLNLRCNRITDFNNFKFKNKNNHNNFVIILAIIVFLLFILLIKTQVFQVKKT